ncbi:MAG: DUF3037 domain-containing protein [Streptosporangiaceae bacterium]
MNLYEYALLRVVPDLERGESVNVGIVVYCQKRDFLGVRFRADEARLEALAPGLDLAGLRAALRGVQAHCEGGDHAADDSLGRRFRWLVAPRSTIVQPGPAHPGLTDDPAKELDRLFRRLVAG